MLERFQFFSKKFIFSLFLASMISNSFEISVLIASERKLSLRGDPDFDSDEEEERMSNLFKASLLKNQYIEPSSSDFYQDDQGRVFRRRSSRLSEEDQDGQDDSGLLFLPSVKPAVKITKTVNVLRKSDKVSSSAQSTNASKFASTTFPDVATKRTPFTVTDSRSNKATSRELTSLPWQVGSQSPALVLHVIPKPPALLENPRNNISKKDAMLASSLALPEKQSPRVATGFTTNELPVFNSGKDQSPASPRRVVFISSSDIDLMAEEVNDSGSRARKALSRARSLDDELLQGDPEVL
jgi:hypothetical protein